MAYFPSSSPHDFSDNRFNFNNTTKLSTRKLSMDTLSPISPLGTSKERGGSGSLPNGHTRYTTNNNNNHATRGSVSSCGQRSNHSSGDSSFSNSSRGSSVNSVFFNAKNNGAPSPGNEYVREPLKVSCNSNMNTLNGPNKLYPNNSYQSNDTTSCTSLKSKLTSEEVTYTINDEMDDASNQVVFLPPPPTDIDSDNDSVGGCDVGGPCSPRHHDWRSSRDLSKSPTSRGLNHGNSKCLCCMLLIFVMSTAGLTAVLVLMYLGKLQLAPIPNVHSYSEQGEVRLGEGALVREVCETPACLRTSASILSRMNMSASPCEDFYNYACGGYLKEVDLSWFRTRIRESPDEIIHEHRKYIIDRLSTSFDASDDKLLASSKEIFRSCLFRSNGIDDRTRSIVTEILDNLGGLMAPTEAPELTMLLANVTRMFGASPFFKVHVHSDKYISLISKVQHYVDPLTSPREYSRSRTATKQTDASANLARLSELLIHLIRPSVNESDARMIVNDFLRLEAHIRRILNTGRDQTDKEKEKEDDSDILCDPISNQKTLGELQIKYSGFGMDWFTFFQNVLDTSDVSDLRFCKVKLSLEFQHLLKITPKTSLRQFIILHTLIHSDLFILLSNAHKERLQTLEGMMSETQEEQCLDLILHFLPTLEKYSGCDEETVFKNRRNAFSTLRNIRTALYSVLTTSLNVPKDNAAVVTNSSMRPVIESVNEELVTRCQSGAGPQGQFDEYSFNSNMLRMIQYHHGEYFRGRLSRSSRDLDLSALWISSSVQGNHRSRIGPIVYPSPVPQPIMYGSLGSFLASRVADVLGIDDLLEHHGNDLLNHSLVLGLAMQLRCFKQMYGNMELLNYGAQVYKIDGEKTKSQQWKDQLAKNLAYKAWKLADHNLEVDHFIPGLTFTRSQMFFISFAQTRCEKISERGILQHYVSDDAPPTIPFRHRINGILRSSDEFSDAFQCSDNVYMNPMDKCRIFG